MRPALRFSALLLATGCVTEPASPGLGTQNPADEGGSERRGRALVPFELTNIPSITPHDMVPVRGVGPVGGSVIYWDNAVRRRIDADITSEDGRFCVELPLPTAGKDYVFTMQALDEQPSEKQQVTVRRSKGAAQLADEEALPPPAPVYEEQTQLRGAVTRTSLVTAAGDRLGALTDGASERMTRLEARPGQSKYLYWELAEPGEVVRLEIGSNQTCPLDDYEVRVADTEADPGAPTGNVGWRPVAVASGAQGSTLTTLSQPAQARWIGVVVNGHGCGLTGGVSEYDIGEVRAVTRHRVEGAVETATTPLAENAVPRTCNPRTH